MAEAMKKEVFGLMYALTEGASQQPAPRSPHRGFAAPLSAA